MTKPWVRIVMVMLISAGCTSSVFSAPGILSNGSETTSTTTNADAGTIADSDSVVAWETDTEGPPNCGSPGLDSLPFLVGNYLWGAPPEQDGWPNGHHEATCTVGSLNAFSKPYRVGLSACMDRDALPLIHSIDLAIYADVMLPERLVSGAMVDVSFVADVDADNPRNYQAWYSLRDATHGHLLLAVFNESGPVVAPKLSGGDPYSSWLVPFTAALVQTNCPLEPSDCQRGAKLRHDALELMLDATRYVIRSGEQRTIADFDIYVGFAGMPDVCNGIATHHPMEAAIIAH